MTVKTKSGVHRKTDAGAAPCCAHRVASEDARFRTLVENSSDVIALLDIEGTILYSSPAITPVAGYAVEEFVGRRAFDFVHPEDLAVCLETLSDVVCHPNTVHRLEFRARHKNGAWITVEAVGVSRLEEPTIGAVVVNYRDITDRKQAEEALRLSEAQYRALM
ncbi:MAG TPA: PAS domain S-box protein [Gemmatimonadales bacterium]|jgi:PAS domain S-box-containing protein|nr:PAS domain S-box protein [Gemmatimonadales bacterium]